MEVIHVNNNRLYTLNNFFTRSTFKNSYSKDNSYYEKIANEYVDDPYGKTNKEIYNKMKKASGLLSINNSATKIYDILRKTIDGEKHE